MAEKQEKPNYWAVVPASVRYDKSLPANAKLLYGEISSRCNVKGYCWTKNRTFAELYETTERTISSWVSALKKSGHIYIQFIYKPGLKEVDERHIYLTCANPFAVAAAPPQSDGEPDAPQSEAEVVKKSSPRGEKNFTTYRKNLQEVVKKRSGGDEENFQENNKAINNKAAAAATINKASGSEKPPEKSAAATESLLEHEFECLETFNDAMESLGGVEGLSSFPDPSQNDPAPPLDAKVILALKQRLKTLNAHLIFDEAFYRQAHVFITANGLDSGYVSWMYEFCTKRKPDNLAGYFFRVFCEPRYADLYREASRPPPAPQPKAITCPVCGNEHDDKDSSCPVCSLNKGDLHDKEKIAREKRLRAMAPDERKAFEVEYSALLAKRTADNFMNMGNQFRSLERKYGLI